MGAALPPVTSGGERSLTPTPPPLDRGRRLKAVSQILRRESGHMVTTIVVLPWPPSVNAYWRTVQGRTMVSKKGRIYKQAATRAVLAAGANKHLPGRLRVKLTAYPPGRRRRDIDNLTKLALDSMQVAGVYLDGNALARRPCPPGGLRHCATLTSSPRERKCVTVRPKFTLGLKCPR